MISYYRAKEAEPYLSSTPLRSLGGLRHTYATLRQSLMAFPILIQNQDHFLRYLVRKKVLGFRLTDEWFNQEMKTGNLIYQHYLLPLSHYFTEAQVQIVIQIVNDYDP